MTKAEKSRLFEILNKLVEIGQIEYEGCTGKSYGFPLSQEELDYIYPFLDSKITTEYEIGHVKFTVDRFMLPVVETIGDTSYLIPIGSYWLDDFDRLISLVNSETFKRIPLSGYRDRSNPDEEEE